MKQPTPLVDKEDVERIVKRDFPSTEYEPVFSVLEKYEYGETHRVQLAAIKNSDGNIETLKQQIDWANSDYRDLLSVAEYPAYTKQWSRIQKLPEEEKHKIIRSDWEQYQTWLNK